MTLLNKTQFLFEGGKLRTFIRHQTHILHVDGKPIKPVTWGEWLEDYRDKEGHTLHIGWVLKETTPHG